MAKIKNGLYIKCIACNTDFYVPSYRIKSAKFCSVYCQNHKQYENKRYKFECIYCKKTIFTSPSRSKLAKKFCSKECWESKTIDRRIHARKSAKNRRLKLNNISSKALRKYVFDFKEKKCEICGYSEYDFCLDIHHIDGNPGNNEFINLKILCCICHKKLHKKLINL